MSTHSTAFRFAISHATSSRFVLRSSLPLENSKLGVFFIPVKVVVPFFFPFSDLVILPSSDGGRSTRRSRRRGPLRPTRRNIQLQHVCACSGATNLTLCRKYVRASIRCNSPPHLDPRTLDQVIRAEFLHPNPVYSRHRIERAYKIPFGMKYDTGIPKRPSLKGKWQDIS